MARTVKVDLLLEASRYIRDAKNAEKATGDLAGGLDDAARAGEKASRATDNLGGGLSDLAGDARRLDSQIGKTKDGIRDLARQIAATSDEAKRAELTKKLNIEQGKHRDHVNLRKLIDFDSAGDMGAELAGKASLTFAQRFGPLLARAPMAGMNPAALAIGAPIVAGVATLVGTAVGGAIIGGVGIGGVLGGLKLAAKDPMVQAAGAQLGEDLSGMLGRASSAFVPETLGAIDTIRRRMDGMEGDFTRVFSAASRYVDPLVDGLLDAAENAMPGIIDAMEHAGPVIEVVADGIRDLGQVVGDGLSELAPYADEGARALQNLFYVMEAGVGVAFDTLENMARLYKVSELVGAALTGDIPRFMALASAQDSAGGASEQLTTGLGAVGRAAGIGAREAGRLVDALQILNGMQLNANEAERAFQAAVDEARDTFDKKVKSIDLGTQRGRDYSKALDGIATTAKTSAQAIYDQTGSVAKANAKIDEGRTALYKQARQYGLSEGAAWAYVNSVLSIPKKWNTDVKATDKATPTINAIKSRIASINGRTVVVAVKYETHGSIKGEHIIGQGTKTFRWGGITEHARDGLLRDAAVYSPAGPARYAFAEPATGGEAFVPRLGDPRRSMAILDKAAGWYGATVQPRHLSSLTASAGGGTTVVNHHHSWQVNVPPTVNKAEVGREIAAALDDWARGNGQSWRSSKK
ncbi:hypothetical protein GCM10010169_23440 [Micromonospora fulviviridis]|uniref:hypothetical protein n=1 Tax=Micromonospora fulviviridis TaxID=47860 RepID=UPI00166EEAFF|nr:hypothetical protein [Micromonospora fulviviridis]GGR78573.1 hypothetical protein GCM10010169_23440 [Micromonospora fulviviridis]